MFETDGWSTSYGVGPIMADRILARGGNPLLFYGESGFAMYIGTAPIEISSADKDRHRLSRSKPASPGMGDAARQRCRHDPHSNG
ncbi:hypothetical protein EGT67_16420 [Prescottella agglutinans]|uniref:Transposase IS116/IS110/IS902 C-terminal domain-containing protein n=1 Tax=Prescottella agglutinans TaxID=1644129 RepID=A0A3S3BSX7_9NOCA|nr:hypothetical protein EGT67_16420 [Prescottella agglutinans]